MLNYITEICREIDSKVRRKVHWSIYDLLTVFGCMCIGTLMIVRCFFGTEITDEAYYVADAKAMLEGNFPYAYCTYSYGSGSCFLLIPFIALYRIFQPELTGVFIYSRLCFLFMWYAILLVIYRILRKSVKRFHALLFVGMLIPYKAGNVLFNFSYNTVPCVLMLFVAFLLYDALENKSGCSIFELIISGFASGIACFAQPGYGIAVAVLGIVLLNRSQGIKDKIRNGFFYGIGGVTEVCVVFIPIIAQVGFITTWSGIMRYFNSYPTNTTMSETTAFGRAMSLVTEFKQFLIVFILLFTAMVVLAKRYVRENEQKLTQIEYEYMSIVAAGFLLVCSFLKSCFRSDSISYMLGMIGTILFCSLLILRGCKKQMLLLYVGLYPILFAIGEAIMVDSSNTVGRFTATVPTLAICLLFFLEESSEITRILATGMTLLCAMELGLGVGSYVYRDDAVTQLTCRVEDGVYKGIYTTKERARNLPELEDYLNQYIEKDEYYEFRDCVPCGYLMMHTGEPCSIATWDSMNYSYGRNAPAENYEYYRRRRAIPNKIFYVDFGRDEKLSIEDPEFQYNEFVEKYYNKIDEIKLNSTFYHVIVFEYSGGFNEDFDYWIDKHMIVTEE